MILARWFLVVPPKDKFVVNLYSIMPYARLKMRVTTEVLHLYSTMFFNKDLKFTWV
jgi:hypothetical protein